MTCVKRKQGRREALGEQEMHRESRLQVAKDLRPQVQQVAQFKHRSKLGDGRHVTGHGSETAAQPEIREGETHTG